MDKKYRNFNGKRLNYRQPKHENGFHEIEDESMEAEQSCSNGVFRNNDDKPSTTKTNRQQTIKSSRSKNRRLPNDVDLSKYNNNNNYTDVQRKLQHIYMMNKEASSSKVTSNARANAVPVTEFVELKDSDSDSDGDVQIQDVASNGVEDESHDEDAEQAIDPIKLQKEIADVSQVPTLCKYEFRFFL